MDLAEISHLPFFVVGLCVDIFFSPAGSISGLTPHAVGTELGQHSGWEGASWLRFREITALELVYLACSLQ